MSELRTTITNFASGAEEDAGAISRLLKYFANLPCRSEGEEHRLIMEIKVLSLLRENVLAHPHLPRVSLDRFAELPGLLVSRGVLSPEFACDSYLWAKHIAGKGLVCDKSVLEMGAGSGIISFLLARLSPPASLCAVDINAFAVEDLRANAAAFGLQGNQFIAIESDLLASVPEHFRFDFAIWAMPWILRNDPHIERIVAETKDPVRRALLRSAVDPGGRTIMRFLTDVKPFLNPGGKVLLISADFIPNEIILSHAESEGYIIEQEIFARDVTVVERPEITLNLHQIELTKT